MNRRVSSWLLVVTLCLTLWPVQGAALSELLKACLGPDSKSACDDLVEQHSRFPPGTFGDHPVASFILLWYSEQLAAIGEPALARIDGQPSEVYRFLWLRSFDRPVALRLESVEGDKSLTVKLMSGAGGYDPGTLIVDRRVGVTPGEWDTFLRLLDEADYWRAAPYDPEDYSGLDGAQWILEASRNGRYHIVDRWSPDQRSSQSTQRFRDACLYLLKLSGLEIQRIY